jgi:hypothetical protein
LMALLYRFCIALSSFFVLCTFPLMEKYQKIKKI